VLGRNTQGVRIIRMNEGERVVAAARMLDDGDKRDEAEGAVVARDEEVSTEHVEASEGEEDEGADGADGADGRDDGDDGDEE